MQELAALRAYVTAPGSNGQNQADSTVRLGVSHSNLKIQFLEIRLDKHMSIDSVKHKLKAHCGTNPGDMQLQLRDDRGRHIANMGDDGRLLGFYSPEDGYEVHILDTNPLSASANGWLEDTSKVEKYMMSDDAYRQRDGTYRKYKEMRRQVLPSQLFCDLHEGFCLQVREEDPEWCAEKELCERRGQTWVPPSKPESSSFQAEAEGLAVGQRCEVQPGGKRGCIRHVGPCEGLPPGWWVGVQYDEPVGKNDGATPKGQRYFQCPAGYGGFVRPDKVQQGDFPPQDEFGLSDGDEI